VENQANLPAIRRKRRMGRPPKHGGYSLYQGDLIKEHPELRRYLEDCRAGLIEDLSAEGEAGLTAGQLILLDRIIQKVGLSRLIEIHVSKSSFLRDPQAKAPEIAPVLQFWLSVNNAIRADLQLLGIERRKMDDTEPDLQRYLRAKAADAAQDVQVRPKGEGKSPWPCRDRPA
jgi:hypothetical protein